MKKFISFFTITVAFPLLFMAFIPQAQNGPTTDHVEGIPVTAFPDATPTTSTPYQLTLMKAFSSANQLLAITQSVIPVSHEINCVSSGCHSSELSILNEHESVPGYNVANKPILCATCHSDNALGMPGQTGVPSFSQVIHQKHGSETNDCYKCHPGPNTQCFRDVMHTGSMVCQDCHGSVSNVGNTIEAGRNPWLQEPSCGATTCHGYTPAGPGPHGYNPLGIKPVTSNIPGKSEILQNFPNPANFMTNIPYNIATGGKVRLEILNLKGESVTTLMDNMLQPGEYKAEFYTAHFPGGTYLCRLDVNGTVDLHKIVVIK